MVYFIKKRTPYAIVSMYSAFINPDHISPFGSTLPAMFKEPFPANNDPKYGYQAMFYSNIFHDWSEEKCKYLAKKTYVKLFFES